MGKGSSFWTLGTGSSNALQRSFFPQTRCAYMLNRSLTMIWHGLGRPSFWNLNEGGFVALLFCRIAFGSNTRGSLTAR